MRSIRHLLKLTARTALLAASMTAPASATLPRFSTATPATASGREEAQSRFVESERGPGLFLARALRGVAGDSVSVRALGSRAASALDCVHADHDIQLDPRTGETVARLDLRIRAEGHALTSVGLSMDQGLTVGTVTADGRDAAVTDSIVEPTRVVQIALSPPLNAGESTVVHVPYTGTLECGTYPDGGGILCSKGDEFSYFAHQSVIPYIFDPSDVQGTTLDAMTRDIVLRVPAEVDVISTGERVSESTGGGLKVSRWTVDHPLSRSLGMYVFAGKLGTKTVAGRTVPTTFVFPNPELPVDDRLVSWSSGVLNFVEQSGGTPLPFQRSLTLVRLPASVADPGTATFGMTLLSESYARAGDLMHEETWAHENSHLFWGITVPEASSTESRLMSEGLAVLSQIDYSWSRHFSNIDRDTYLARRFVPIGLDLVEQGQDLAPVVLGPDDTPPDNFRTSLYTLWAYYKTSATLDHLRATIGDEAFASGLKLYVKQCSYVGCSPADFRTVLEQSTGKELKTFFGRWVTATSRPQVTIGFTPVHGGADIELSKDDDDSMTLELWLRLDDGRLVKQRVELAGRTTHVHLGTSAWVRSVAISPRHDVLVDARSTIEGDLDFDGETDGNDLLRCTPLVGKAYKTTTAIGLWNVDERFDPRCDVNHDFLIDEDDITAISQSFGTLRSP